MSDRPEQNTNGKGAGAPPGNRNAQRHGMRGGKLPVRCRYVENAVNKFRRTLEDALLEAKGEISLLDAAAINSATKWETHGQLARYWLRHEVDVLSLSDRLRFSEAIAKASDARDRAIRVLGLDAPPRSPWLDVEPPDALGAPDDAPDADNVPAEPQGAHGDD